MWIQNEQDLNKNTCELHVYWRGIQFLLCTLVPWLRQPLKKRHSATDLSIQHDHPSDSEAAGSK